LAQSAPTSEIVPNGKLRMGTVRVEVVLSVSEPVGKFLAEQLGVPFEPIVYANPELYAQSFGKGEWDIAIGPRVLASAQSSDVLADMWLVDLLYVVGPGGHFADASQVDRPGVKVAAVQGSPSDRYLTRALKSAELVRMPMSPHIGHDVAEMLRSGKADVIGADAGIGYETAGVLPGVKILPGAFSTVQIALAVPKGRSSAAQARLAAMINAAKRSGVVQKAIEAHDLKGVRVAPE